MELHHSCSVRFGLDHGTYDTGQNPRKFFNDVWSSADGITWTQHTASAPWAPREYHDIAVFDGKLWVMEGYNGANLNDVWYSSNGVNWTEVPNTPWAPRHAASVFVYDDALWMVAGITPQTDVWRLSPNASGRRRGQWRNQRQLDVGWRQIAGAGAVPEPAAWVLGLLALMLPASRRGWISNAKSHH